MSCSQTNLNPETPTFSIPTPTLLSSYTPITGQRLYVCDNPEPLKSSIFTSSPIVTLWSDKVPSTSSVRYRVFMWHHNDTAATIKYGLTIVNSGSSTITVSNVKYETTVTSNNGDILTNAGLCLAKSLLGQTMTSEANISIASNKTTTIKEFQLAAGQVRGLIMEFTLSSSSVMTSVIRTVAASSTTAALNTHFKDPIGTDGDHPRGTWTYADVTGTASITISSGGTSNSISILDKTSSVFPDLGKGTFANSGCYGGIYKLNLTIKNSSSKPTVNLYLNPRGGKYVGAIKVGSNPVYGIAKTTPITQTVKIGGFSIASGQSITVPIQVTSGGGASTPIAFFARTV